MTSSATTGVRVRSAILASGDGRSLPRAIASPVRLSPASTPSREPAAAIAASTGTTTRHGPVTRSASGASEVARASGPSTRRHVVATAA